MEKIANQEMSKTKIHKNFSVSKKVFLFGVQLQLDSEVIPNAASKLKTINLATNFS